MVSPLSLSASSKIFNTATYIPKDLKYLRMFCGCSVPTKNTPISLHVSVHQKHFYIYVNWTSSKPAILNTNAQDKAPMAGRSERAGAEMAQIR
jgi:hypothetical protein